MKRFLSFTSVLIGFALFLGCSDDTPVNPQVEATTEVEAVQAAPAAAKSPTRVSGGGRAVAAPFVTYVQSNGNLPVNVPSLNTIGNRFSFSFHARVDRNGNVRGRMQLRDRNLGMTIRSDVAELSVPHPNHQAPIDANGNVGQGLSASMKSSTNSVKVNGVLQPGWKFVNSPLFDGGEGKQGTGDTICFELFDAGGVKLLQWSAFLSVGNVQVVQ